MRTAIRFLGAPRAVPGATAIMGVAIVTVIEVAVHG